MAESIDRIGVGKQMAEYAIHSPTTSTRWQCNKGSFPDFINKSRIPSFHILKSREEMNGKLQLTSDCISLLKLMRQIFRFIYTTNNTNIVIKRSSNISNV